MKYLGIILGIVSAVLIIVAAYGVKSSFNNNDGVQDQYIKSDPKIGSAGSDHKHMSMHVMISDELFNFATPEYQIQSDLVHFEDNNGIFIHVHATGITLPFFFETLGGKLTPSCLYIANKEYCTNNNGELRILVNGIDWNDKISKYILRQGDKILINYGNDSDTKLRLKYNNIPDTPDNL